MERFPMTQKGSLLLHLEPTLGQGFEITPNHPKINLVFGSNLGRRLSIWRNSTAVLNHFSARVFLASPFGSIQAWFPANWPKCSQHGPKFVNMYPNWVPQKWNIACFGSPWLRLGWKPAQMNPNPSRTLVDHLWTSFGPVLDQFWICFGPFWAQWQIVPRSPV